jgi:predicted nucleic acid-binding protein
MRVVSNTSPISNLAIIGRLDLLKRRYGTVLIPPAVAAELSALSHPAAKAQIAAALAEGWMVTEQAPPPSPPLPFPLDAGETEAIGLAVGTRADVLLMDERRGREAARRNGLAVGGVLGELLHARQTGVLASLRPEINRLRAEAGFFVDAEIERFILSQVGE